MSVVVSRVVINKAKNITHKTKVIINNMFTRENSMIIQQLTDCNDYLYRFVRIQVNYWNRKLL